VAYLKEARKDQKTSSKRSVSVASNPVGTEAFTGNYAHISLITQSHSHVTIPTLRTRRRMENGGVAPRMLNLGTR
jgi:hypothetical protein